ncbi:hypothetical protein IMW75_11035 [Pseudomonas gregormendelii]|uniref:Uncharacterized protein n=1 Tax=Pseudomonas gregormendelii TaxID=1628277 RepID=A0ABS3AF65_9PSED|nr:hypothetical protein [Pseudomonas gregormendelii]MBN3965802.1 hypothetical protein [Pseudomonas gregormendelii]MBN3965813.1 hypothetical protein [Pseudomonas gregormendelii]
MINSLQGTAISKGQQRQQEFQDRCRAAFLNPVLADSVAATIKVIEERKEQGIKPEKIWTKDFEESGTCSVAEWMGY